ncbi:hypothetical protein [Flavobacterium sp.]|uniref:hypothetical protein n=1 Tax=Flavobacterium sp. TaxID=239 RepID=UPI0025B9924C|nr:hypothetical protein [Flavobacterium sp.]MBA4153794.1 outer membrane insertion C- signal [Flavobacterium sp.]
MRKLFIVFVFLLSGLYQTTAQEVGIRFGEMTGNNVAVDGVFSLGEFSRIHADVSFGDGLGVDALWDFIYKPIDDDFNWYVGFGPSLLIDDPFFLGVSGEIGIEYHFDTVPIAIGLDYRPTFWIVEETDFDAGGFGLNIRYVFDK